MAPEAIRLSSVGSSVWTGKCASEMVFICVAGAHWKTLGTTYSGRMLLLTEAIWPGSCFVGLHVDDIITCCLPGYEHLLDEVKQSFVWGSDWEKDDFIFVGRHIKRQDDGGYTLDQAHYVADILKTRIDKDPEERLMDHPELVTEFRSGIGSLQWLAGTTRGDLSISLPMSPCCRRSTMS